jgi:hypothetical protein
MKNYFIFILLVYSINGACHFKTKAASAPQPLDTVKIYNVYCSFKEENSITAWGGNYSSFYPIICPRKNFSG